MFLKPCSLLCRHALQSFPLRSVNVACVCNLVDSTCINAADKVDQVALQLELSHHSATSRVQRSLAARLLGGSRLAARATRSMSDEICSLVKVVRITTEIVKVQSRVHISINSHYSTISFFYLLLLCIVHQVQSTKPLLFCPAGYAADPPGTLASAYHLLLATARRRCTKGNCGLNAVLQWQLLPTHAAIPLQLCKVSAAVLGLQ